MASREDATNMLGPWGGSGGTAWSFEKAQAITKIKICVGDVINSITFQYMDGETARWSPRYGGAGGTPVEIELGPAEFILSIKGYYGAYAGMTIIYSLTFVTTVREYGPYGREHGTQFYVPKGTGWINSFHGRSGDLLDAIGVYRKTSFEIDLGTNHYLTAISGYYGIFHGNRGNYYGYTVIRSLTFVSTMGTHGPYGPKAGTAFSFPVKVGKVVAFFGRAGQWLDALGFYLKPNLV
ncbi:jacalin-related lectin 3-like isoform X3 [Phoenix dactylifera]|uniref:Jacalin-related lectin 3-like isoform X3 n=1 Tax=Phoenix dactylifera TaxID=42345 RepID=A0A8B8ZRG7_PHODC|nr:jacalin-related lectin 3-like isoform X3 [Phoenix dactylifera]